jgi:hypothetical protein
VPLSFFGLCGLRLADQTIDQMQHDFAVVSVQRIFDRFDVLLTQVLQA